VQQKDRLSQACPFSPFLGPVGMMLSGSGSVSRTNPPPLRARRLKNLFPFPPGRPDDVVFSFERLVVGQRRLRFPFFECFFFHETPQTPREDDFFKGGEEVCTTHRIPFSGNALSQWFPRVGVGMFHLSARGYCTPRSRSLPLFSDRSDKGAPRLFQ